MMVLRLGRERSGLWVLVEEGWWGGIESGKAESVMKWRSKLRETGDKKGVVGVVGSLWLDGC